MTYNQRAFVHGTHGASMGLLDQTAHSSIDYLGHQ